MWIDNDFPKLLGAELYRPHPAYIIGDGSRACGGS